MPTTAGGAQTLLYNSALSQPAVSAIIQPSTAGSASPSVEELPSEILSSILGRVSAETGGLEAAGVCRRWRGLSEHSQRRLSLPSHVSEDALMALLARYPNVRVLSFDAASGRDRQGRQQLVSEAEEDTPSATGGRMQLAWEAQEGSLSGRSRHGRRQLISEAEEEAADPWELEEEEDSPDESQSPFLAAKGQGPPAQRQGGPLLAWAYRGLSLLGTPRAQRQGQGQGQGQGLRPRYGRGMAPVCSASVQPRGSDSPGAPGRQ